ncbi:dTDP-4-dehydrorhamnose 3,5-epimerase [Parasphingorhabdus sp.]|uniref:dTDP-4-dehydrorhamnose 3,5-epimerase n=1 Tax=Parasphingorhabdus sp. TaxID=2709688 RepID=UPI003A8E302B
MRIIETTIPDVKILEPKVFGDDRGFFMESWNKAAFEDVSEDHQFVQDNHSKSQAGVLRGLHYQIVQPQGKLVRVVSGSVYDVVVDIRASSPSFGKWVGVELSGSNHRMLWVPPGFAHGFLCLENNTDFLYKCTDFYAPEHERSLLWSDPAIGIEWPLEKITPLLSSKDKDAPLLAEAELFS